MDKDNIHLINNSLDNDYYQRYVSVNKDISYTKLDHYTIYQKIGQGAFGKVYEGRTNNNVQIAIKTIDIRQIKQKVNQRVKEIHLRLVKSQDIIMRICNSPNLMKCLDVYQNKDIKIMILQYCNGGTLQDYIQRRGKIFEEEAIAILKQILNGIKELHSNNIIHRDLKSQNILVHNQLFKIADFGFSKRLQLQHTYQASIGTCLGTITNMAPEIMKRKEYGLKADIWSIGIILFQMIFGSFPFVARDKKALLQQINNSFIHKRQRITFKNVRASVQISTLIQQMLQPDQTKRIGWKQLIEHKIFIKNPNQIPRSIIPNLPLDLSSRIEAQATEQNHEKNNNIIIANILITIKNCNVQLLKMNPSSIVLIQQNKSSKDGHYDSTKKCLYQCLKNELIYNEILCRIEDNKMLDLSQRKVLEFLCVLSSRCYINMSNIKDFLKKDENKYSYIPPVVSSCISLYNKIKLKFDKYTTLLRQKEDSIFSKIYDGLKSIGYKQQMDKIDKYLCGIPEHDYKTQDQLQFIESYYIKTLKDQLQGQQTIKDKVKKYMIHYRQINLINFNKNIKEINFDIYVQSLINK